MSAASGESRLFFLLSVAVLLDGDDVTAVGALKAPELRIAAEPGKDASEHHFAWTLRALAALRNEIGHRCATRSDGRCLRNKKSQSVDSDDGAVLDDFDRDVMALDDLGNVLTSLNLDETAIE